MNPCEADQCNRIAHGATGYARGETIELCAEHLQDAIDERADRARRGRERQETAA